jgi:hypothetical protein
LYSKYHTKEAVEEFGDFRMGGKLILTVKHVDNLMLLAKKESVLHGMIDRPMEIRCYGMEINVEKPYGNENVKATIHNTDYNRLKTTGEC